MQGKSYDSGYGSGRNGSSYGGGSYGGSSYGSSYGGGGGWGQAGDIVPWRMGDANRAPGEYVAVRRLRFIPTYQPEAMDFVSFFFKNPILTATIFVAHTHFTLLSRTSRGRRL